MSRTYKATGINLKTLPLGEADRLLTILTREHGLIKAVAMGARKTHSKLAGRSGLFVVNDLLIAKGRSLDKITQAESLESYPGLAQDLKKLMAGQYLAELCLCQALGDQPQEELFVLLNTHLKRLEQSPSALILPYLIQGIYQLLALGGIAPQIDACCLTRQSLTPDLANPNWCAGFSISAGGTVTLEALENLQNGSHPNKPNSQNQYSTALSSTFPSSPPRSVKPLKRSAQMNRAITAIELTLLQAIAQAKLFQDDSSPNLVLPDLSQFSALIGDWLSIERILRQYAQYHFDRPIRSAALIETCFSL